MWYISTSEAEPKSPLVPNNVTKDKIKKNLKDKSFPHEIQCQCELRTLHAATQSGRYVIRN